jgi:hypothetical protein
MLELGDGISVIEIPLFELDFSLLIDLSCRINVAVIWTVGA